MWTYRVAGIVLFSLGLAAVAMAETFPPETLVSGIPGDEATCRSHPNRVWTVIDGVGDCIRYYAAGLSAGVNPAVVIVVRGDRFVAVDGGRSSDSAVGYDDNSAEAQQANAEAFSREISLPVIVVARPGLYGSSGNHSLRRRMREMRLMDATIAEIRKRTQIQRTGLTGQSGGGTVAAYVLTQQADLSCVTLTSAELSMRTVFRTPAASQYDVAHAAVLHDPIDHVAEIQRNMDRNLFVVWSEGDQYSPPENQREYVEALREQGHRVNLIEGEAVGASHHTLDHTGRIITALCLNGTSAEEIRDRIQRGRVKG